MIYFILFIEFFKIGLFSLGGGLATLPFLYALSEKYTWLNASMLPNMIAVSESTPGPIGVNMATYAGFEATGILGGIIATLGLVTPSVIIILIIATFLSRLNENKYVKSSFYGLRPTVTALIALSGLEIFKDSILTLDAFQQSYQILDLVNFKSLILLIIFYFLITKIKLHPILFILIGALVGVFLPL